MESYTIIFRTIAQQNGRPTMTRNKFVTGMTKGKTLLATIVSEFAPGYETVRLLSSDGNNVDIDLAETVELLQAGAEVPGISQDSAQKTGVILVGGGERPIQQHLSLSDGSRVALPPPNQPAAKVYKKGRMQASDPAKSKLGMGTGKQLPLGAGPVLHRWTRFLCSREAEAPWAFHDFDKQHLRDATVRGLLQRSELAGETYNKVGSAMKG